jgi:tRNA modification GTPase
LLDSPPSDWPVPVEQTFTTSVQSHQGIQELGDALARALKDWQERSLDVVPMTGARCQSALANASQSLDIALRATLDSAGEEIIAGELRLALHELGEVAGTVANNDILDALFSRFCIGK